MPIKMTPAERCDYRYAKWVDIVNLRHANYYSYVKPDDFKMSMKITIHCPKHGTTTQLASSHKLCKPFCCAGTPNARDTILDKFKNVHGDEYDYSLIDYKTALLPVIIICREHGSFKQSPNTHLAGRGCNKCANIKRSLNNSASTSEFIKKAKLIHGDKYDYSLVKYVNNLTVIEIICPNHGAFVQIPSNHTHKSHPHGCPKCACGGTSHAEDRIFKFIESLGVEVIQSDRKLIAPLEIDIVVPVLKLAIEFNGTHWHTEKFKPKSYHYDKMKKTNSAGYSLLQIKEWEYDDPIKRAIIMSMIIYKLNLSERIYARKTRVVPIPTLRAKRFYQENHLQGAGRCTRKQTHFGLFFNKTLVMAISYDVERRYLVRLCTKQGLAVIGGASKLFKTMPRGEWMTYGANDLGGALAQYSNVIKSTQTTPRYWWVKNGAVINRQTVQKHKLLKKYPEIDPKLTEVEIMQSMGHFRYFDSGNTKLEFWL